MKRLRRWWRSRIDGAQRLEGAFDRIQVVATGVAIMFPLMPTARLQFWSGWLSRNRVRLTNLRRSPEVSNGR